MPAEIPPALKDGLTFAPVDPLGKDQRVTVFTRKEVKGWQNKAAGKNFKDGYLNITQGMEQEQIDSLNLLLWAQAITLSKYAYPDSVKIDLETKQELESVAGRAYFENLVKPEIQSEEEAYDRSWHKLFPDRIIVGHLRKPKAAKEQKQNNEDLMPLGIWLFQRLQLFEQDLAGRPPEIREYIGILEEALKFSKKNKIKDPGLWDLIIGNLNLTKELEPEFTDIAEKMGLMGAKKERIIKRAAAYEEMMDRTGFNYTMYQSLGLGFRGLRDRHEEYLRRYNLDNYVHQDNLDGSFVSYGATDGIMRAFLISRYTLRQESGVKNYNPRILFPTPGFTTIAKMAENALGMETVEMTTKKENNFFPTAGQLKTFLEQPENDDVLIIDLSFINNPSSTIVPAQQFKEVLEVIKNHKNTKGLKMIVVNDAAYLGMGDQEKFKQLGQILNETVTRSFHVSPMTKTYAQPAIRSGSVFTADEDLAKHIPAVTKWLVPSMSYPMMIRALATGDYVHYENLLEYFGMLKTRQNKFISALSVRPDIFNLEKSFLANDSNENLGAFYVFVPIHKNLNPLYLPAMTGLFGNLDATFYLSQDPQRESYIRFAVGVEELSDKKIIKLENDLLRWKEVWDNVMPDSGRQ